MNAELIQRFSRLDTEDKHLLCVVLSNQCLHKSSPEAIKKLGRSGAEWLIDYETNLINISPPPQK